jgi:hypothetical protein
MSLATDLAVVAAAVPQVIQRALSPVGLEALGGAEQVVAQAVDLPTARTQEQVVVEATACAL